jgi:hypothetical protein
MREATVPMGTSRSRATSGALLELEQEKGLAQLFRHFFEARGEQRDRTFLVEDLVREVRHGHLV